MVSPRRVVAVTFGLVGAGALFGGIAGGIALLIAWVPTEGLPSTAAEVWGALGLGAVYGAPIGAIIGPPTAWLLLRHVPLGRLFMGTAAGTIVGGVFGWLIPSTESLDQPMNALLCAFSGFLAAALFMRISARRLACRDQ